MGETPAERIYSSHNVEFLMVDSTYIILLDPRFEVFNLMLMLSFLWSKYIVKEIGSGLD